jgi:hypothetical protein
MSQTGKAPRNAQRESNLAEKYQTAGQCTTVMIRNIPNEYSQDELIAEVSDAMGSSVFFDFFYLPWDTQNDGNVGYAFVNFLDSAAAQKAVRIFSNYHFRLHDSRKVGKVLPAHIQGLENNLRHLQDRAVVLGNHPCSPVVMWRGQKVELSLIFQELRTQDTLRKFESGGHHSSPGRPKQSEKKQGLLSPPGSVGANMGQPMYEDSFAQLLDRAAGLVTVDGLPARQANLQGVQGVQGVGWPGAQMAQGAAGPFFSPGSTGSFSASGGYAGTSSAFPQTPGMIGFQGLLPPGTGSGLAAQAGLLPPGTGSGLAAQAGSIAMPPGDFTVAGSLARSLNATAPAWMPQQDRQTPFPSSSSLLANEAQVQTMPFSMLSSQSYPAQPAVTGRVLSDIDSLFMSDDYEFDRGLSAASSLPLASLSAMDLPPGVFPAPNLGPVGIGAQSSNLSNDIAALQKNSAELAALMNLKLQAAKAESLVSEQAAAVRSFASTPAQNATLASRFGIQPVPRPKSFTGVKKLYTVPDKISESAPSSNHTRSDDGCAEGLQPSLSPTRGAPGLSREILPGSIPDQSRLPVEVPFTEIAVRNADKDVLEKFLRKFGN